jgi:hypothetical protein
MNAYDIKSDLPTVSEAGKRLAEILRMARGTEKVIKIIHGYGSSGVGGSIKQAVHKTLSQQKNARAIRAFIPGEAIGTLKGFDADITRFRHLIETDADFRKCNDGITYVIF